jgi:hypothetical protein
LTRKKLAERQIKGSSIGDFIQVELFGLFSPVRFNADTSGISMSATRLIQLQQSDPDIQFPSLTAAELSTLSVLSACVSSPKCSSSSVRPSTSCVSHVSNVASSGNALHGRNVGAIVCPTWIRKGICDFDHMCILGYNNNINHQLYNTSI